MTYKTGRLVISKVISAVANCWQAADDAAVKWRLMILAGGRKVGVLQRQAYPWRELTNRLTRFDVRLAATVYSGLKTFYVTCHAIDRCTFFFGEKFFKAWKTILFCRVAVPSSIRTITTIPTSFSSLHCCFFSPHGEIFHRRGRFWIRQLLCLVTVFRKTDM